MNFYTLVFCPVESAEMKLQYLQWVLNLKLNSFDWMVFLARDVRMFTFLICLNFSVQTMWIRTNNVLCIQLICCANEKENNKNESLFQHLTAISDFSLYGYSWVFFSSFLFSFFASNKEAACKMSKLFNCLSYAHNDKYGNYLLFTLYIRMCSCIV